MRSEKPEATVQNLSKDVTPKDNVINNDNNTPVLAQSAGLWEEFIQFIQCYKWNSSALKLYGIMCDVTLHRKSSVRLFSPRP